MNKEIAKKLQQFIFHIGMDGSIEVVTRDTYRDLMNNRENVLIFDSFDTAIDILLRTGGDREKIEQLLNGKR